MNLNRIWLRYRGLRYLTLGIALLLAYQAAATRYNDPADLLQAQIYSGLLFIGAIAAGFISLRGIGEIAPVLINELLPGRYEVGAEIEYRAGEPLIWVTRWEGHKRYLPLAVMDPGGSQSISTWSYFERSSEGIMRQFFSRQQLHGADPLPEADNGAFAIVPGPAQELEQGRAH